jgi:hypothetical protein
LSSRRRTEPTARGTRTPRTGRERTRGRWLCLRRWEQALKGTAFGSCAPYGRPKRRPTLVVDLPRARHIGADAVAFCRVVFPTHASRRRRKRPALLDRFPTGGNTGTGATATEEGETCSRAQASRAVGGLLICRVSTILAPAGQLAQGASRKRRGPTATPFNCANLARFGSRSAGPRESTVLPGPSPSRSPRHRGRSRDGSPSSAAPPSSRVWSSS